MCYIWEMACMSAVRGIFSPVFGGWVKVGDRGLHGGGTGRFGG